MKKTWFLAVLTIMLGTNAFGAPFCPGSTISFQWLQDADDDEFMYTSMAVFDEAKKLESDNGGKLTKGQVYECDGEQGCSHGKYFLTTADSVFKGEKTGDMQLYKCEQTDSDEWSNQPLVPCTAVPTSYTDQTANFIYLDRWDFIYIRDDSTLEYCYLTGAMLDCFIAKKSDPKVYWQNNECKCQESGGKEYVWNQQQKKCNPISAAVKQKECPAGSSDKITKAADCKSGETFECLKQSDNGCRCGKCSPKLENRKTCREQRTTTEGKACCDLPKEVAEWTGKECRCLVSGMKFVERNGRGYCEATQSDKTKPFECNTDTLKLIANWATQCKDNADIMTLINKIQEMCRANTKSEQDFNKLWGSLLELQPENCTQTSSAEVTITITKLTEGVNDAYSRLVSIHDKFRDKKSVWKDAEGNFNTARLASDSIAGVVLGTAGGLITSHVVKKNQVENGFEDIKCTIGGQNVAEWGDQFRVGIQ
ncbi:MAG: hypothetical protein ACLRFO_00155 [Alphaproteobacteria bacterium]